MVYKMQSLKHNGVYVPQYEPKGFSVRIHGTPVELSPKTEMMAIFWVKKEQSLTSPPDKVFYNNFINDFKEALQQENPSSQLLQNLQLRDDVDPLLNGKPRDDLEIDFSEILQYVKKEQDDKQKMSKEEKKKLALQRKQNREKLKEDYGYAYLDGEKIEIANWTAEPSCIFAGRGDHPKRGKWKQGPEQKDIILNLPKDVAKPPGWKDKVWEPERMYLAKWQDKLTGKMKYVWFSDSAFLKQDKEKEKFGKASVLGRKFQQVQDHIIRNLTSDDEATRKVATVSWLIMGVNLRVGDEKDPDEADTVGAITLRPEHISIEGNMVHFDFLGKDSVRWVKHVEAPASVVQNLKQCAANCKANLFEEVNSRKVSRFLSQVMPGLTAKVFRTWKCTDVLKRELDNCGVTKDNPEHEKLQCAKMANLEVAKIANHKRKVPANFDERLATKEEKLKQLEAGLEEKKKEGKKTDALMKRIDKTKVDLELTRETREYNLGTSLKSYIDPRAYAKWAKQVNFPLEKIYSKTLRKKFSWALGKLDE